MTLREPLMAQLAVQAAWTYEARLAFAFPPSALIRGSLAVTSGDVSGILMILLVLGNKKRAPDWVPVSFR